LTFDIIFNKIPFLKDAENNNDLNFLREVIKLKAMTVGISDGVQLPI